MAGMKLPLIAEIAKNTYAINEFGMSTVYLLTGSGEGGSICENQ